MASHSETAGAITRRFLTPPMRDVHDDVRTWMNGAGLTVRVDAVGNIIGRRNARSLDAPTLLIGSHLDTVPNAGPYDGILGVLAAIAVVESLGETLLPFAIDVIGFSEEEGVRFAKPYLGSLAVAGHFEKGWLELLDGNGVSMRAAIKEFGLSPDSIQSCTCVAKSTLGYVEMHIEQGPVLARAEQPVAAVSAIAGQSRLRLIFRGCPGHAGTMPMSPRSDALVAASRFVVEVAQCGLRTEGLRATVGSIAAQPNVRNVIPGHVEVSLDVRHADNAVRLAAVEELIQAASTFARQENGEMVILDRQDQSATHSDPRLTTVLSKAIERCKLAPMSMLSGAGHDAVAMALAVPTTMLFIRQPRGISHHPDEDVQSSDVAVAIEVMNQFIRDLAQPENC